MGWAPVAPSLVSTPCLAFLLFSSLLQKLPGTTSQIKLLAPLIFVPESAPAESRKEGLSDEVNESHRYLGVPRQKRWGGWVCKSVCWVLTQTLWEITRAHWLEKGRGKNKRETEVSII